MWLNWWLRGLCSRSRTGVCVEDPVGVAAAVCAVVDILPATAAVIVVVTAEDVGPSRAPMV